MKRAIGDGCRRLTQSARRAVPAAPGVGGHTTHKVVAAKRRAALFVNKSSRCELANLGRWPLTSGARG